MLRAAVLLLLLANGLFFVWTQGWLAPLLMPPADEREPGRLAAQVRPELITVLTSEQARAASEAPTAVPAAPAAASEPAVEQHACVEAGPLDGAEVRAVEALMAEAGVPDGAVQREQVGSTTTWGVVMGRFADRDAMRAKAEELRRLGVAYDELTTPDPLVPGLRLGNYSDRYGAEAALRQLALKGVRSARVAELPAGTIRHWLRAPRADAELQTRLTGLPGGPPSARFRPCATQ